MRVTVLTVAALLTLARCAFAGRRVALSLEPAQWDQAVPSPGLDPPEVDLAT